MRLFQVDAFADSAFAGDPAEARWMQSVAGEMNLSETAFVEPRAAGYGLRWFTPMAEMSLCGHATLASAHVLYETGLAEPAELVRFDSLSGPLTARREGGLLVLDFPARPARPAPAPPGLLAALGVDGAEWTG